MLDGEVETAEKAVKDLYDSTVNLLDARNDMEFDIFQILERLELSAEELEKTDPAKAEPIRELLHRFGDEN